MADSSRVFAGVCRSGAASSRTVAAWTLSVIIQLIWLLNGAALVLAEDSVATPLPASPGTRPADVAGDDIGKLIRLLGDDAYSVRQDAARRLLAAGTAAHGPLSAVAEVADPEIRAAAQRLIALIDQADFQHRLADFAADVDGKRGLTMPGWNQFQDLVGGDVAARNLFVEMQRHEGPLLAEVFDEPTGRRPRAWEQRFVQSMLKAPYLGKRSVATPLGSSATMIFLGSLPRPVISDRSATYLADLVRRPPVQQCLQGPNRQDAVRRLVVAWVNHCPNRNQVVVGQRLATALMFELSEAVPLALDVARAEQDYLSTHPMTRLSALILVARLGDRSDSARLEPLLDDDTVCRSLGVLPGGAQPPRDVQIRDAALVVMVRLTEQNPAEYGYSHARLQAQSLLDPLSLYPDSDETRTKAKSQWSAWKAAQAGGSNTATQVN